MKRFVIPLLVLFSAGICFVGAETDQSQQTNSPATAKTSENLEQPGEPPLIVHEWGTFTSFSGSDGVKLEYRPLLENDLPRFVYTTRPSPLQIFSKRSLRAIQRMETPVTYFYTPVERDITAKVEFPQGLLTEYYPAVEKVIPEQLTWPLTADESNAAQPTLKNGMLDWGKLHLIPTDSLRAHVADEELARRIGREVEQVMYEPAAGFPHYFAARDTDSAVVQKRTGTAPSTVDYFEKFLFYRGVGNFELPLTLSESEAGSFELKNSGDLDVRSLFLVTVEGEQVRFSHYPSIAANTEMVLQQSRNVSDVKDLANAMTAALVEEGLYFKEAKAMVACWRASWFGEEGTRLLYLVPTSVTDQLIPLHITPQPDEMVRILVGRMEIMPKSQEERVLDLVHSSATARRSINEDTEFRSPALDELLALGRLAEPALVRVQNITNDEQLRSEAKRLMDEVEP